MEKIETLAEEVSQRYGCFVYAVKWGQRKSQKVLKVFIDKEPSGVSLEDCENISKSLSFLLDGVEDLPEEGYHLEISSPGLDRFLEKPWHFKKVEKSDIKVKWTQGTLEGSLKSFDEMNNILILEEKNKKQHEIPLKDVKKAYKVFR